ncbi:MAG: helix-turn-helix domain-containing protein [Ferrimicrobium sp.]
MSEYPLILTSDQAAEILQCSVNHVQALAHDGIIPANRSPNGRWRFSRDALVKWASGIEERCTT